MNPQLFISTNIREAAFDLQRYKHLELCKYQLASFSTYPAMRMSSYGVKEKNPFKLEIRLIVINPLMPRDILVNIRLEF